jgi:hypothetical protein
MNPIHIALTTLSNQVDPAELSQVAAALQIQATRDFGPIWNVSATVDAFALSDIPAGYWPIIVQDTIDQPGALGYHQTRGDGTPYALVLYGPTWSLTASHECLEILADPFASQKHTGQSLIAAQGRVDYLVEVCDPCEDPAFAYPVNGVMVSDFYTPNFFDPVASSQVRYSYSGVITQPFQVLANGYLSWFASDGLIYQAKADANGTITFTEGASPTNRNCLPLREFVDSLTPDHQRRLSNATRGPTLEAAHTNAAKARQTYGARFRSDITLRFGAPTPELPDQPAA